MKKKKKSKRGERSGVSPIPCQSGRGREGGPSLRGNTPFGMDRGILPKQESRDKGRFSSMKKEKVRERGFVFDDDGADIEFKRDKKPVWRKNESTCTRRETWLEGKTDHFKGFFDPGYLNKGYPRDPDRVRTGVGRGEEIHEKLPRAPGAERVRTLRQKKTSHNPMSWEIKKKANAGTKPASANGCAKAGHPFSFGKKGGFGKTFSEKRPPLSSIGCQRLLGERLLSVTREWLRFAGSDPGFPDRTRNSAGGGVERSRKVYSGEGNRKRVATMFKCWAGSKAAQAPVLGEKGKDRQRRGGGGTTASIPGGVWSQKRTKKGEAACSAQKLKLMP